MQIPDDHAESYPRYESEAALPDLTDVIVTETERLHLIALLETPGIGPVVAKNLVAAAQGAKAVFERPPGWWKKVGNIGPKIIEALQKKTGFSAAEAELETAVRHGVEILTYWDPAYPERLKTIYDAPLVLYKRGPLDFNAHPTIAVVGSRSASSYGKTNAAVFAEAFVAAGLNVVSGLARGIDIATHRAVLQAGGYTTGVMAHGHAHLYPPQHKKTVDQLLESGAMLSELRYHVRPDSRHFPARNRIISGMAQAVFVVEASDKGGSLLTARIGFEQNRDVYAIPGDIHRPSSAGCNALIRDNLAKLVTSPADVLQELGLGTGSPQNARSTKPFKPVNLPLSAAEQRALNLLTREGLLLDELALRLQLPVGEVMAALLALEFKGLVAQQPGRRFVRL